MLTVLSFAKELARISLEKFIPPAVVMVFPELILL
jgi:hypothetical protein